MINYERWEVSTTNNVTDNYHYKREKKILEERKWKVSLETKVSTYSFPTRKGRRTFKKEYTAITYNKPVITST